MALPFVADHPDRDRVTGMGTVYNGALATLLVARPELGVDIVSVIPETLWHERRNSAGRYQWVREAVRMLDAAEAYPIVFHGIGPSLGSADEIDTAHVGQLASAIERYRPLWFSEHLATTRVGSGGTAAHAGIGLPAAFDEPTLDMFIAKVAITMTTLDIPILVENSAVYVHMPGCRWTEAGVINHLRKAIGFGVLLDLHNLVVNKINLGWDLDAYLDAMDVANVVEIHVAGGEQMGRWYADACSGAGPKQVWSLLERLSNARRICRWSPSSCRNHAIRRSGNSVRTRAHPCPKHFSEAFPDVT